MKEDIRSEMLPKWEEQYKGLPILSNVFAEREYWFKPVTFAELQRAYTIALESGELDLHALDIEILRASVLSPKELVEEMEKDKTKYPGSLLDSLMYQIYAVSGNVKLPMIDGETYIEHAYVDQDNRQKYSPDKNDMLTWQEKYKYIPIRVTQFTYTATDYVYRGYDLGEYDEMRKEFGIANAGSMAEHLTAGETQRILCEKFVLYPNMKELFESDNIPGYIPAMLAEGIYYASGGMIDEPKIHNLL